MSDWSHDSLPRLDRRGFLGTACAGLAAVSGSSLNVGQQRRIETWTDPDAAREYPSREYALTNDLDEETDGYEEHVTKPEGGWEPIGTTEKPFVGRLDGNGHEIVGLSIDRPDENHVGLFGNCEGTTANLTLGDCAVTGKRGVGGLAGEINATGADDTARSQPADSSQGEIRNVSITGDIDGVAVVGGLVGHCGRGGSIRDASVSNTVSGSNRVGGLLGSGRSCQLRGIDTESTVRGSDKIGGVVGALHPERLRDVSASGKIDGDRNVGGLVGSLSARRNGVTGTVEAVSADVRATGNWAVGGLIGRCEYATLTDATASGPVRGGSGVGGLVGRSADNALRTVTATGAVDGTDTVGGLVGHSARDTVQDAAASGDVDGESVVGGLVADLVVTEIIAASASGTVTGEHTVGGLAGSTEGRFARSENHVYKSRLRTVSAHNDVSGGRLVGGLIGGVNTTEMTACAVSGQVSGREYIGGLVGFAGTAILGRSQIGISDVQVLTAVAGETTVGGLCGIAEQGRIERSVVAGTLDGTDTVGGVVGKREAGHMLSFEGVYWDSETVGTTEATGDGDSSGQPIALATTAATGEAAREHMSVLDFAETWSVVTGPSGYPTLDAPDTIPTVESQ